MDRSEEFARRFLELCNEFGVTALDSCRCCGPWVHGGEVNMDKFHFQDGMLSWESAPLNPEDDGAYCEIRNDDCK